VPALAGPSATCGGCAPIGSGNPAVIGTRRTCRNRLLLHPAG
jgi:hypothetical protein